MDLFQDLKSELGGTTKSVVPEYHYGAKGSKSPMHQKIPSIPVSPIQEARDRYRSSNRAPEIRDDLTEGITIESILDPTAKEQPGAYQLTLRVKYQTNLGESLCVVGDIAELGNWKNFNCRMSWTEGHIWVIKDLPVSSKAYFNYKYVLMKDDKASTWE